MTTRIQVVFYSMYGHVYRLAEAVSAGAATRLETFLRQCRRPSGPQASTRMRTWPGFGSVNGFSVSSSLPGLTACTARYLDRACAIVSSADFRVS
jgi:hypothetical protein